MFTKIKEIVYTDKYKLNKGLYITDDYCDTIITYIVKTTYTLLWCFTWTTFKIKQIIPYIKHPFVDGEYLHNHRLRAAAKARHIIANVKIIDIKYEQKEINEPMG